MDNDVFFQHDVKLSDEQKINSLEGNLSFKKCGEYLKLTKNVKSPGSDGFTVDFYKFFWKDIGAFVFRSLYFSYETGNFSELQT